MKVDGKALASEILASVKAELAGKTLIVRAVCVQPSAATESFLTAKAKRAQEAGMQLEVMRLADDATNEDVIAAVQKDGADAVIVQLPLPGHLDTQLILDAIPLNKDADVLSAKAYSAFEAGGIMPPVADAVREILERNNIRVEGKQCLVIGEGRLVGAPVAAWLWREGARTTVHSKETEGTPDFASMDIIVSGAGSPGLVTSGMVKQGAVLIDAGTSEEGGVLKGDINPAAYEKASLYTPVPGGVGPVAVACLYRNVLFLRGWRKARVGVHSGGL